MATRIFEMAAVTIGGDFAGVRRVPFLAKQNLSPTGSSLPSNAFNSATNLITVQADEDVLIEIGSGTPIADATSYKLAGGEERDFWVEGGHKLALKTA